MHSVACTVIIYLPTNVLKLEANKLCIFNKTCLGKHIMDPAK